MAKDYQSDQGKKERTKTQSFGSLYNQQSSTRGSPQIEFPHVKQNDGSPTALRRNPIRQAKERWGWSPYAYRFLRIADTAKGEAAEFKKQTWRQLFQLVAKKIKKECAKGRQMPTRLHVLQASCVPQKKWKSTWTKRSVETLSLIDLVSFL